MITNHTCLNLNKKSVRKKVITKLQKLGYKINDNATALETKTVIKELQLKNGVTADGCIGYKTRPLLNGDIVRYKNIYGIYRGNGYVKEIKSSIEKRKTNNIPLNCVNCGALLQSNHCDYCDTDYSNYQVHEKLKTKTDISYDDITVSGMLFNQLREYTT